LEKSEIEGGFDFVQSKYSAYFFDFESASANLLSKA